MSQCPVCREELPHEHWRVFADHAACEKPVPPPLPASDADRSDEVGEASLITKGVDLLRSAVEGAMTTISPHTNAKNLDE